MGNDRNPNQWTLVEVLGLLVMIAVVIGLIHMGWDALSSTSGK